MIARIIKAEVCVICRRRRLRPITQTGEAFDNFTIRRKPNSIIAFYFTIINVEAFREFTK